jgi:hypothetical protein
MVQWQQTPLSGGFLRRDSVEGRPALLDALTAAVRAEDSSLFVVDEGQDPGEEFLAIAAEEFVAGHPNLLEEGVAGEILKLATAERNMISRAELLILLSALGRTIGGTGRRPLCPNHHIALSAFSYACFHYWLLWEAF